MRLWLGFKTFKAVSSPSTAYWSRNTQPTLTASSLVLHRAATAPHIFPCRLFNSCKMLQAPAKELDDQLLPVSLLCGFLGAGKTTLMKHILETKHAEEDFRCAVIVNDMAALNIDKDLIDQSALIQTDPNKPMEPTDTVIAMQNGCFCCTLQSDLVAQIIELANKKMFNYMLIEASGVSEPSQIAPLFSPCDDGHDHAQAHTTGPQLSELARLDTCVTVIDAAEFFSNLASMKNYEEGEKKGSITELMMEQVEFSNVVVLNKIDLVNKEQQADILDRIENLNPKAKVLKSCQSKINVMEILNTRLYNEEDITANSVFAEASRVKATETVKVEPEKTESCCAKSVEKEGKKCCASKKAKVGQEIDTGMSQIILGVVGNNKEMTRHEKRFGINSFIYRSRRPFHPGRLHDSFFDPFFMYELRKESDQGDTASESDLEKLQTNAAEKQEKRLAVMGELMRSKGFIWIATSQFFMGAWQQAGNVLRVMPARPWLCEMRERWEGTPYEPMALKEMQNENGEEYPYGDRMQEIVFIGKDLNHELIQTLLDNCLLTDQEMEMGPRKWQESWYDSDDKIQLPTIFEPQVATVIEYDDVTGDEIQHPTIVQPQIATVIEYNG